MKDLSYNDISLVPELSIVNSRSECSTETRFLSYLFSMPVIPANMRCSIDFETADLCIKNSIFYALHRFGDQDALLDWIGKRQNQPGYISISVGIQDNDFDFIKYLDSIGYAVNFVTIDVAHAHCLKTRDFLEKINKYKRKKTFRPNLIVGNVATPEAVSDLANWGANAVKVGVGGGRACSTRIQTGFGLPMFSCVERCSKVGIPIIADGGIKYYGDVAKALVAGASMVMSGSMFAKCLDSPAETFQRTETVYTELGPRTYNIGPLMKRWYGSASEMNKGSDRHVEGIVIEEECNELTYEQMISKWKQSLQSSISYAGGKSISAFSNVKFVTV